MGRLGDLTILVPFDVSAAEPPDFDVVDHLGAVDVVLLGYFPVPDQAAPALVREQFGDEATTRLADVAADHGDPEDVLVFTHDRDATIDRVADEYGVDAVLTAGHAAVADRILVPLRGAVNRERILRAVADLLLAGDETATLFHALAEDADPDEGERLLTEAVDHLVDAGVDRDRLDWELETDPDAGTAIVDRAAAYDLVVLGETEPSLRERIIGDDLSALLDALDAPALVVRDDA